jgi:hypothetical protein
MRVIDEHDDHKDIIAFFAEQEEGEARKESKEAGMIITSQNISSDESKQLTFGTCKLGAHAELLGETAIAFFRIFYA